MKLKIVAPISVPTPFSNVTVTGHSAASEVLVYATVPI